MNGYLSQIAVRAGGVTTPHSLTPVHQLQGPFTPRQMETGSERTSVLPAPDATSSVREGPPSMLPPEQPIQRVIPEETLQQEIRPITPVRYLERYLERSDARKPANRPETMERTPFSNTQTSSGPISPGQTIPKMTPVEDLKLNAASGNERMSPVLMQPPSDTGVSHLAQTVLPEQGPPKETTILHKEERTIQSIEPPKQQEKTVTMLHQPPVNTQAPTVLTPRINAGTPAPQGKKPVPPKVTIGRITVEVVAPPPVQTATRSKPRSAGPPVPAPGSNDIHKLSFGFGQL